ncbi:MAG: hypothetical protein AAF840_07505, partial [Bacteroidota bacterium]
RGIATSEALTQKMKANTQDDVLNAWLYPLYLNLHGASPALLPTLVSHLTSLPHRGNYFQPLRYILKASEQLADYATVGALLYWIWSGMSESSVQKRYDYKQINGRWRSVLRSRSAFHPAMPYDWQNPTSVPEMSQRRNTKWGFTASTRQYLLNRGYRLLTDLGERREGQAYTAMATELLLALNGQPVKPAFEELTGHYVYDATTRRHRYIQSKIYYPEGADLVPLHWIINGGTGGYEVDPQKAFVRITNDQQNLTGRRERYAALWDQQPKPVIRLLGESILRMVQDFALRIFEANPAFVSAVTTNDLTKLIASDHPKLVALVPQILSNRPELVTASITYALIVNDQGALRTWAERHGKITFPQIFGYLLVEDAPACLDRAVAWLERHHTTDLAQLPEVQLSALAQHPLPAAGHLAAKLIGARKPLPYTLVLQLMTAKHLDVRAAGIQLFGTLPLPDLYANHRETILSMCVAEPAEVRAAALPVARKVAGQYADFGREAVVTLANFLRLRGQATDVHTTISELLCQPPMRPHLIELPEAEVWQLLRSRKAPAQQVGFAALSDRKAIGALATEELVELGQHDWVEVRAFARQRFIVNAERTVYEVRDFIQLIDTNWEDTRDFVKQFLRERLTARDWTPEVLIALLDIPREDVQVFALDFVEQYIKKEDATDFLLRASQHPGHYVQGFAAGWLEAHAAGQPDVIKQLIPFFQTLLGQISRGRVAKDRVFTFLATESAKQETIARLVIPMLQRLMLTIAIGDRARCLQLLNDLRRQYPLLATPLQLTDTSSPITQQLS